MLGRSVLIGIVVYGIVAICDMSLGSGGPPIVAGSVAVGLGVLSWNALRQKERYAQLVGLAEVVEARDTATANHLRTVEDLAARVSSELGLPVSIVEDYGSAALLHDLGKVAVSPRILRKPGKLDSEEWEEMRSHATMGGAILRVLPGFSTAAAIAGHHHERWDGRGYPDGLRGKNIPLPARIVAVVDAFDAMTTDRPYHRGISTHAALVELDRQKDAQFDPAVVGAFRRVVEWGGRPPRWQFYPMIEE
jgi:HD-GYP domain-containing protein (c-di-GMP phosphodiesterase class II)